MPFEVVPAMGISEDVALMLAYEKGAELIVAVGTHFNLIEFMERNRAGMSSTFLTRLRVGEILVDAKGVSRLVSRRVGLWPLVALGVDRSRRDRGRRHRLAGGRAPDRADRPAGPRLARPRRSARAVRMKATRELLAPRPDVWGFLGEPFHLADWWPGIAGVQPDRRGLGRGRTLAGRRRQRADAAPAARARREHSSYRVRHAGLFAFHLAGEKLDVRVELEATAADRTRATITVEGPWLIAYRRTLRAQGGRSAVRPVPDCGDTLTACSISATTSPRWRPSSSP